MSDVEGALRRARIRIRYHGWRRSGQGKSVPGWTLKEAIIGHNPTVIPEHELQAILAVSEAVGVPSEELDAWNDAPYRTVSDVLKAISRARKSIKAPPATLPDKCAQRRMAGVIDTIDLECTPDEGEITADDAFRAIVETPPIQALAQFPQLEEVASGDGPFAPTPDLSSTLSSTIDEVVEDQQVDLEEVIKNHLRGN